VGLVEGYRTAKVAFGASARTSSPSTSPCPARRSWPRLRRSALSCSAPGSGSWPVSKKVRPWPDPRAGGPDGARPLSSRWSARTLPSRIASCALIWDSYFMQIAAVVASRATCDRKHVGALLVRDRIISPPATTAASAACPTATTSATCSRTGTASPPSTPRRCDSSGRATACASRAPTSIRPPAPAGRASRWSRNAGIKRIVYGEFYRDERIFEVAQKVGIELGGSFRTTP